MRPLLLPILASLAILPSVLGQGSLTPPGAPAPTQKTLTQVEPRTPVQSLPGDSSAHFIISTPGSYYLTDNITASAAKAGIKIVASGVTLDLAGFALLGAGVGTHGIAVTFGVVNADQVRIGNGTISNWTGRGVYSVGSPAVQGLQISDLIVANCATGGVTVDTGGNVTVRNVAVRGGKEGINLTTISATPMFGLVVNCNVSDISATAAVNGIQATQVLGCTVNKVSSTSGLVSGIQASQVIDCQVDAISATGGSCYGIFANDTARCRISAISGTSFTTGIGGQSNFSTATQCAVSNVTTSAGAAIVGIQVAKVSQCFVGSLNSASAATGIQALNGGGVDACMVDVVSSSGGGSIVGIDGGKITHCSAYRIGGGPGTPIGITGAAVANCAVFTVGSNNSTAGTQGFGITAQTVTECSVETIGSASCPANITGIKGSTVSQCRATAIRGAASVTGISAAVASTCAVVTMAGGSATANFTGILADRVEACEVNGLSGTAAQGTVGVAAGFVTGTRVFNITENVASSGAGIRLQSGGGGAVNCHVQGVSHVGIECANSAQAVRDCFVQGDTSFGGTLGATGILINSSTGHIRVEGNHVSRFTTGINASTSAGIFVVRNTVGSCNTDITVTANVKVGPIVSAAGPIAAATSPWANFTF